MLVVGVYIAFVIIIVCKYLIYTYIATYHSTLHPMVNPPGNGIHPGFNFF